MSQEPTRPPGPILIVPYVWIGDFVRCHSVVKLLRAQAPERPVDIVSSTLCAPLADYMPGRAAGDRRRPAAAAARPRRCNAQLAGKLRAGQLRRRRW